MKKKIFYTVAIIIILTLTSIAITKYFKYQEYRKSISDISIINYKNLTLKGMEFYNKGDYNCFLLFNSDCNLCMDEIEDIVDNIKIFKDVNFYLVSNQTEEQLIEYSEDSEFLGLKNFTVLLDRNNDINKFFNYSGNPSTFMYDNDGKLIDFKKGFLQFYDLKRMIN
ncbi:redoxin domain-containing protein [Lutibacter sp.]|uniref:peroxiredoxin family protein n=1 Tax=Lutibacter sp. TaxID=1925666 RepID=UPI0025C64BFB|nr:redoxin domain-containing protein [Lutibacter sp.]MCF6168568.1 redoxin domain-containing protein [Lutibacter sp.]